MSTKNEGGPAFPRQLAQVENPERFDVAELQGQSGMTLRDYFAAKAMQAIISTSIPSEGDADFLDGDKIEMSFQWIPRTAYDFADAMLAARKGE